MSAQRFPQQRTFSGSRAAPTRARGKFWREGSDREELRAYRRQQGGPGLERTPEGRGWQPRGGFISEA